LVAAWCGKWTLARIGVVAIVAGQPLRWLFERLDTSRAREDPICVERCRTNSGF
jgi:hypothetical protein